MFNEPMLKDGALRGKTIIITGGGTGLGKSIATYCAELGANLVITSRKMEVLEKTAAELSEKTKSAIHPVQCDVRNYEEVEKVLQTAIEKFGRVDALLNNAAGNFVKVVQRLPVKIEFTDVSDSLVKKLRPGLNVAVDVHLD